MLVNGVNIKDIKDIQDVMSALVTINQQIENSNEIFEENFDFLNTFQTKFKSQMNLLEELSEKINGLEKIEISISKDLDGEIEDFKSKTEEIKKEFSKVFAETIKGFNIDEHKTIASKKLSESIEGINFEFSKFQILQNDLASIKSNYIAIINTMNEKISEFRNEALREQKSLSVWVIFLAFGFGFATASGMAMYFLKGIN